MPVDMRADFGRVAKLLADYGPLQVREPYVKSLDQGLFEIRIRGRDGIARAVYVVAKPKRLVVVLVFIKKEQKTKPS